MDILTMTLVNNYSWRFEYLKISSKPNWIWFGNEHWIKCSCNDHCMISLRNDISKITTSSKQTPFNFSGDLKVFLPRPLSGKNHKANTNMMRIILARALQQWWRQWWHWFIAGAPMARAEHSRELPVAHKLCQALAFAATMYQHVPSTAATMYQVAHKLCHLCLCQVPPGWAKQKMQKLGWQFWEIQC